MEFGKTEDLGSVDWTLPGETDLSQLTFAQLGPPDTFGVYIGSTAWGQKGLVGNVYPAGTRPGDMLEAYGRQFNTIELNTTFYRVPDRRQVLKWYAAVPDDFRFCPKVNKAISQATDLGVQTSRTLDFVKAIQHFEHKLGPCFIQLPADFTTERWGALEEWLDAWPPHLRLAVELRHESWFCTSVGADAFASFAARGVGGVITDVAGRRDVAHMHVTAPFAVVRWVGNVDASDEGRLADWAERLTRWGRRGLREAYVFTHQPEELPSAEAAAQLHAALLARKADLPLRSRAPAYGFGESRTTPAKGPGNAQGELFL